MKFIFNDTTEVLFFSMRVIIFIGNNYKIQQWKTFERIVNKLIKSIVIIFKNNKP